MGENESYVVEEPEQWIQRVTDRELHFVAVASGGMTTCDLIAREFGLSQDEIWEQTYRVNSTGETGTFGPRIPLTVLPQFEWGGAPGIRGGRTQHGPRDRAENLDEWLRACTADVIVAERQYLRIGNLLVDLNPYGGGFDYGVAFPIVAEMLVEEFGRDHVTFFPRRR